MPKRRKHKQWYHSKTYWYAILTLVVAWIPQVIDILSGYEAGKVSLEMSLLLTFNSIAVAILRHFTSVPVTPITESNIKEVSSYATAPVERTEL